MIKQNSEEALSSIQIPGPSPLSPNQEKKIPREVLRSAWELLPIEEKRNCTLKLVLINHNFFTAYFREIWLIILLITLIVIFLSLLLFIKEKAWAISVLMAFYLSVLLASVRLFAQYRKCCISKRIFLYNGYFVFRRIYWWGGGGTELLFSLRRWVFYIFL